LYTRSKVIQTGANSFNKGNGQWLRIYNHIYTRNMEGTTTTTSPSTQQITVRLAGQRQKTCVLYLKPAKSIADLRKFCIMLLSARRQLI
jgi:hypothetical protein